MIALSPQDASGVVLNILAFAAAAFLLFHADARRNTPVDARLTALFGLLLVLVGVRSARWALALEDLRRVEEALAGSLPLAALLLAEGLMRRHAPPLLKRGLLTGAVVFSIAALVRPMAVNMAFVAALGVFVGGGLLAVALLLALRDRRSLAPAENAAIGALGLALAAALPFVASDFLYAAGRSPVRAGGLGLLLVTYAAARLGRGSSGGAVLLDMALAAFSAGAAFLTFVAVMGAPSLTTGLAFLSVILGLVLVILIIQALREQDAARAQDSLIEALALAPDSPADAFLDHVRDVPALARAVLLEESALSDYDAASLRSALSASPVASLPELKIMGRAGEPLAALLDAHEGTHAVLLNETPLRLLSVNMPAYGAGPGVAVQLRLLQKLAMAAARAR